MKNRLILLAMLLVTVVTVQAQNENLALTFANAEITNDGVTDFYEVDLMITKQATSPDFKLGNGLVYIDYNTAAFGPAINGAQVEFTRPAGSILDQSVTAVEGLKVYKNLSVNTNDMDTFAIFWEIDRSSSTFTDNITGTTQLLAHLKIEMLDASASPDICFNLIGDEFDDQFYTACGSANGGPFDTADCTNFQGFNILNYDGTDCSGAIVPVDLCTGGTRIWDTVTGWDGTVPDNTMKAVINGVYVTGTDGDLDVCELTITATGGLTVTALGSALVQNDITVEGSLTVEHTANLVQINDAATVTNTGTINVNVTTAMVDTRDFVMLGSPMDTETREDVWATAFNVQDFDPTLFVPFTPQEMGVVYNFQGNSVDVWNPKSGVLTAGEGYLVFPQTGYSAPGGQFDYTYDAGTLNNGVYTRNLNFNGTQEGSPNMLSNPYASAMDADVFFTENPTIDAVYFWEHGAAPSPTVPGPNPANFTMRDVSAYNGTGGVMAASGAGTIPNGIIATAQGFGVFAAANVDATFNNSMRLTAGNTTLRTNEVEKDRLWLRVEDLSYSEGANMLVGFLPGATEGIDSRYDSAVIENTVSLYSYINDDYTQGYTIQGREQFSVDATVKLGFNTYIEEEVAYKISLSDFDGIAWDQAHAYLVDNETGIVTNLHKNDYTFTAIEGNYENRFLLKFQNRILGINENALSNVSVYPNPTSKFLNIGSPDSLIKSIKVIDLRGRQVMDVNDIDDTNISIDVSLLKSAVYFVKIQTDLGVAEIKFIRE